MIWDDPNYQLAIGRLSRDSFTPPHTGQRPIILPRDAIVPRGQAILYRVQDNDGQPLARLLEVIQGSYFGEAAEAFGKLNECDCIVTRSNERLPQVGIWQSTISDKFSACHA